MNRQSGPSILERSIWTPFYLNLTLVVVLFSIAILAVMIVQADGAAESLVAARGRSHFAAILMTRRWNAEHGGVYVEKRAGVVSNPYLENPDIEAVDGRIFTKKNPALMTREISEIAGRGDDLRFRITSLKPLNPDNAPDPFEREALTAFERGEREMTTKATNGDRTWFRYMAPLMAEKSCLSCHGAQGYSEGDVRGGISITYDITDFEKSRRSSTLYVAGGLTLIAGGLLGLVFLFTGRLMRALKKAHERIDEIATRDELTGLLNRRALTEDCEAEFARARRHGRIISVMMIDVDRFKRINDELGHAAGDAALKTVGKLIQSEKRIDDVAGRYGGDEFLMLLPETDGNGGLTKAEMMRRRIEAATILAGKNQVLISASFGVAQLKSGHASFDELVADADKALYLAKARGRNIAILAE